MSEAAGIMFALRGPVVGDLALSRIHSQQRHSAKTIRLRRVGLLLGGRGGGGVVAGP